MGNPLEITLFLALFLGASFALGLVVLQSMIFMYLFSGKSLINRVFLGLIVLLFTGLFSGMAFYALI